MTPCEHASNESLRMLNIIYIAFSLGEENGGRIHFVSYFQFISYSFTFFVLYLTSHPQLHGSHLTSVITVAPEEPRAAKTAGGASISAVVTHVVSGHTSPIGTTIDSDPSDAKARDSKD